MSADRIGVSVRDPSKANDLAARGVRVRRGDFGDSASLADAFEGVKQVLIVSSNAAAGGGDPLAQHRNAIRAAKAAGARRIVYTSHMGASANSAFPPMRGHAATEAMLAAPADGKVSWTAHADLAAGAARILGHEGRFDGPTPPLTAGEALDLADIAAVLSKQTGRVIERRIVADDGHSARLAGFGLPRPAVDITLGLFRASRAHEFEAVDPTLAMLLSRQPTAMRDLLRQ